MFCLWKKYENSLFFFMGLLLLNIFKFVFSEWFDIFMHSIWWWSSFIQNWWFDSFAQVIDWSPKDFSWFTILKETLSHLDLLFYFFSHLLLDSSYFKPNVLWHGHEIVWLVLKTLIFLDFFLFFLFLHISNFFSYSFSSV